MRTRHVRNNQRTQRGAVLFVSLILLLILTLIGVTAARLQSSEEIMARNENNHQLAMQSTEAALRVGENLVRIGGFDVSKPGMFDLAAETQSPAASSVADTVNWGSPGTQTMAYAGPALGNAPASPQPAQIIVENLPPAATTILCTAQYGANGDCSVYRVTAHAQGADGTASATMQSIYRTPK